MHTQKIRTSAIPTEWTQEFLTTDRLQLEVLEETVHYDSQTDGGPSPIIRKNEDGIHLRSFKDSKQIVDVRVVNIAGSVNDKYDLYYLLPCETVSTERKNFDIISVRYEGMSKGLPGGSFKNTVILDLWYEGRKIHTKPSGKKLQMCGRISSSLSIAVAEHVIAKVNDCQRYLDEVSAEVDAFKEAIQWLKANSVGEEVSTQKEIVVNGVTYLKYSPDNYICWPGNGDHHAQEFISRSSDLKFVSEISLRAECILGMPKLLDAPMRVENTTMSMINYSYNLGFKIKRRVLAEKLAEMGYKAYYLNSERPLCIVYIPDTDQVDSRLFARRSKKASVQSFIFRESGSVQHSGLDVSKMETGYILLMVDVISLRKDIMKEV